MSDDLIEDMFSSVDPYYPGSKRKRKAVAEKPATMDTPEAPEWDARVYKKTLPNGTDVEMFTLGSLAQALGRPIITLRLWETMGYLPSAPYRLSDKVDKHGDIRKGRKLYSRAMVEAAVEIFTRHGILGLNRIEWSEYPIVPQELSDAWDSLRLLDN